MHELNRGVFVREASLDEVADLFRLRRVLECSSVRTPEPPEAAVARLRSAVAEGETAAREGRWQEVGTANMHFHLAVGALAGSPRIDELMEQLMAELRLVFHVMAAPQKFHAPYLEDNARICALVQAGRGEEAAALLDAYLARAEQQLVQAYRLVAHATASA